MYSLGPNNSSPGVRNFYFAGASVRPMTSNGVITSFNESISDFLVFENASTSGTFDISADYGQGGIRYNITINGNINGLSQERLNYANSLINSSRFSILAEMSDRSVYFFSNTLFSATNSQITSSNGIAFTITGTSGTSISQIDQDLANMITGDVVIPAENLLDKDLDIITDRNGENITI